MSESKPTTCALWLEEFDPKEREILKNAHNPHEFIAQCASIIREQKQHIHALESLSLELLYVGEEVFSEESKQRFGLLFDKECVGEAEGALRLGVRWRRFRESKTHSKVLGHLARIFIRLLQGQKSHKALQIAQKIEHKNSEVVSPFTLSHLELLLHKEVRLEKKARCVAIFTLKSLHVFGSYDEAEVQGVKTQAIEIVYHKCLAAFKDSIILGSSEGGFAFVLDNALPSKLLEELSSLIAQHEAQKFSYHHNLFSCEFEVEVFEAHTLKNDESIEALQAHYRALPKAQVEIIAQRLDSEFSESSPNPPNQSNPKG